MIATAERKEHPIFQVLNPDIERQAILNGSGEAVETYYSNREKLIALAAHDSFRYGYEPPIWKKADEQVAELRAKFPRGVIHLVNLGGNRSAKSTRAAKRVMQHMIANPGARVWCLQSTEAASQADQQPIIFNFIPPEWRPDTGRLKPKGDRSTKIVYSDSGGFTKNTFILPNGSQCWFKFYGANVKTLEGSEIDFCWADELIQPDWIEAIRFRLVNRNGQFLITFTPAEHYSDTVKMYLDGARTIEEATADLLPIYGPAGDLVGHEKVPKVQQSGIPQARIIYFHTSDNPFGNYEGMVMEQRGAPRERVLMRVYGVPTQDFASQMSFDQSTHVISRARFAELEKQYPRGTRYLLVDPCSGRNWFMVWAFCYAPDKVIFYREWPSHGHPGAYIEGIGDPGPWAILGGTAFRRESGKPAYDGDPGPAQLPFRFGLLRYKEIILAAEKTGAGTETIFERWMDSRYGNSAVTDRESQTTLIQQMDAIAMNFCAMTSESRILNVQDGSIDMINQALHYDKTIPIGQYCDADARVNEPNMLVSEDCPNIIFALQNWTGKDGLHGACKDPIDVIRGFVLSRLGYVSPESLAVRHGGGGY